MKITIEKCMALAYSTVILSAIEIPFINAQVLFTGGALISILLTILYASTKVPVWLREVNIDKRVDAKLDEFDDKYNKSTQTLMDNNNKNVQEMTKIHNRVVGLESATSASFRGRR